MSTTLRFNDENVKGKSAIKLKQQRVIPVAELLYTDSKNLPSALPSSSMLFTTDTRNLYIGTGTEIKRVNLGSDGEIIDKTDYLTRVEAAQLYVQKEYLNPSTVITQEKLDEAIGVLGGTIDDLIRDNEYKADKEDVYTKEETNKNFVDNQEFDTGLSKKVDKEVLTNTGNHSFVKNDSTGVTLRFQNVANDTESFINVGKDSIRFYTKKTKGDMFGGRLYVTPDGAFYTSTNDEDFSKNDEILTQKDLVEVQAMNMEMKEFCDETRQMAIRSMESARNSELNVEKILNQTQSVSEQSQRAIEAANNALDIMNKVQSQLSDAYVNSNSALEKSESANDVALVAKQESSDALNYVHRFESSIVTQLNQLIKEVNELKTGGTTPGEEPTPEPVSVYKIVKVEDFDDVYEVPYHTESEDLNLPETVDVTLDSPEHNGDVIHESVGVTWLTERFQAHETSYSQQIIGIPTEDGRITNPNHLFAVYTVKVLPEEEIVNPEPVSWSVVFALHSMVDVIDNFSTIIGHPEIQSSDMMGDMDSHDNYVEPTIEMFLLGTLRDRREGNDCFVLTESDQQNMNRSILDITENGFKVPILGVSTEEEIAAYDSQTLTRAMVLSNGAYQYTDGTLVFDHATDASNVYLIRKKNNV